MINNQDYRGMTRKRRISPEAATGRMLNRLILVAIGAAVILVFLSSLYVVSIIPETQNRIITPNEFAEKRAIVSSKEMKSTDVQEGVKKEGRFGNEVVLAYDSDGIPGYIHDPYYIRKHPPSFTSTFSNKHICDDPPGHGREGRAGIRGLRKIEIQSQAVTSVKLLCMVYSHEGNHETLVRAIAETYGPLCDGFMVASNVTDVTIGAVHLGHRGLEEYGNMWSKVRAMWIYAHEHYINDFDWYVYHKVVRS